MQGSHTTVPFCFIKNENTHTTHLQVEYVKMILFCRRMVAQPLDVRDWITKISHVLKPYTPWVSHVCPPPKFMFGRNYCMFCSRQNGILAIHVFVVMSFR